MRLRSLSRQALWLRRPIERDNDEEECGRSFEYDTVASSLAGTGSARAELSWAEQPSVLSSRSNRTEMDRTGPGRTALLFGAARELTFGRNWLRSTRTQLARGTQLVTRTRKFKIEQRAASSQSQLAPITHRHAQLAASCELTLTARSQLGVCGRAVGSLARMNSQAARSVSCQLGSFATAAVALARKQASKRASKHERAASGNRAAPARAA